MMLLSDYQALETKIRPAVARDGGDIKFISLRRAWLS